MKATDDDSHNVFRNKRDRNSGTGAQDSSATDPIVNEIKRQASMLFNKKKYGPAIQKYTELIKMCPNDSRNYGNRAASYMMLEKYIQALKDAKKSVELDPMFITGHCRVIKSAMKLHKFSEIDSSISKLQTIDPSNEILKYQASKMRELVLNLENEVLANDAKDYVKVLEHINKSLMICPQYLVYKMMKAECLVNLGRLKEAGALASEILKQDPNNSNIHYILGRSLRQENIEKSVHHFEEAFRLNPRCIKERSFYESAKKFLEKKNEANNAYKSQNFSEAFTQYNELLVECQEDMSMKMTLHFNMAQASYKMGRLDRCIEECQWVLIFKPSHLRARMRCAQCYLDKREFVKAIEDLEKAWIIESSAEVLRMLQEAYKLLGASHNGSYVILGVVHDASKEVIIKAYKELTKLHHPDRHANATDEQKRYHEVKCKEITRAYRLLMDQEAANHSHSSSAGGNQGKTSAGGFKTNSSNNNRQQSSSGGTNDNSTGSQSSSGRDTNDNRRKSSSETGKNKSTGTKSSTRGSNTYNEQPSFSGSRPSAHGHNNQKSSSKTSNEHSSGAHRDDRKRRRSPSSDEDDFWNEEEDDNDSDGYDSYGESRSRKPWKGKYQRYCHYCDDFIYGVNEICRTCGFYGA